MNQSRFGFLPKMLYLCTTRRKLRSFLLFLTPKMAKTTSKVIKISSNIGETIFDVVSPTLHIIIFTSNFALKTSNFKQNTTFFVFLKQTKEQRDFYRVQITEYRAQLPSGWFLVNSFTRQLVY